MGKTMTVKEIAETLNVSRESTMELTEEILSYIEKI